MARNEENQEVCDMIKEYLDLKNFKIASSAFKSECKTRNLILKSNTEITSKTSGKSELVMVLN